uniref:Uncharacterized protein TCIL3000_10_4800 n=1 Tax=Trypanosoma congolense (strain IL3000) TaxID=1068625 RepID=G0UWF1_TRYCI|nr:unnamed protein product [Trypanosoma congolense IL3000]
MVRGPAGSLRGLPWRSPWSTTLRCGSSFLPGIPVTSRRLLSTTPLETLIINGAEWSSDNYYHRLGFHDEVKDSNRIKEHYRILAKHFHPDNPNAPPNSTAAFQNIKEAYDHLMESVKDEGHHRSTETQYSYRYTDHERRLHQMRFLGEGVGLFVAMTFLFIFVVSRHNNNRLEARHLGNLAIIFLTIQVFPRLLAAAILYACHSNYLVSIAELTEQAGVSLVAEPRGSDLIIRVEGVKESARNSVVLQVTCSHGDFHPQGAISDNERKGGEEEGSQIPSACMLTTMTFDLGETVVSIPITNSTGGSAVYRVKVVDEKRAFVIADRTFRL